MGRLMWKLHVTSTSLGTFIWLGYNNPIGDQEQTTWTCKDGMSFVSLPTKKGKSLCYISLLFMHKNLCCYL